MDPALQGIHDSMQRNAALFVRRSVEEMMQDNGGSEDAMSHDAATISCTLLQLAIELYVKAAIIREQGLHEVVETKKHAGDDLVRLIARFATNDLHTKQFWQLKKVLKTHPDKYGLDETDWDFIDEFQSLRNKLVHVGYAFHPYDLFDLRTDTIFVITHTLVPLITHEYVVNPSEVLEQHLGEGVFNKLISYQPYIGRMESMVRDLDGRALRCWDCHNPTFSQEEMKCFCCCRCYENAIDFVDCMYCNEKRAVVYDCLNIDMRNFINALCLACGATCGVVCCPHCGWAERVKYTQCVNPKQHVCGACDLTFEIKTVT